MSDDARGTYNTNIHVKVKTTNSRVCEYNDLYILVKRTITITAEEADAAIINAGKK